MLFNSFQYFFFVLIIITLIFFIKKKSIQHIILLIGSCFFYFIDSGYFVLLLFYSSILDFYLGKKIHKTTEKFKRKLFLTLSLIGNLGLLIYFKYSNFGINIINNLFETSTGFYLPLLDIILPIGISFYTFQSMSYTIDIYQRKLEPISSFLKFSLFVAFFPQLVAGPIVRAKEFLPQLLEKITLKAENMKLGITLIGWGIVKKVVFADNIAPLVNYMFSDIIGRGSTYIIIASIAFGIQIYCDFSAYTNMAIGSARILGFNFPKNFDKPYFAKNPTDFWRRWHMSLSRWFKDYVYINLGGNRKGKVRTYRNLLLTMLLVGFWHGAAWNFVIWGVYNGVLLAVHKMILNIKTNMDKKIISNSKIKTFISIITTQYFILIGWLIFRIESLDQLIYGIKQFFIINVTKSGIQNLIKELTPYKFSFIFILIFFITHTITYHQKNNILWLSQLKMKYWTLFIALVILLLLLFAPTFTTEFIYFRF
jgi:alginate O-acetyltransferase complex protein AlgI